MDEDEPSKPRMDRYQVAPITLEDFRRQRKAAKAAEAAGLPPPPPVGEMAALAAQAQAQAQAQAPAQAQAQASVPEGPCCSTCRAALEDEWRNCVVCDALVCDECPMHADPRDEAEGICTRCGPAAWQVV